MSIHEDISWQVLRRIIRQWAGESAELAEVKPLQGGVINTTLCLTLEDGQRAVLKISPHRVNLDYEREARQLDLLRLLGVPTPRVHCMDPGSLDQPYSFLLLEFVDGVDLGEARHRCSNEQYEQLQLDLAEVMLRMHGQTSPHYCRVTDGCPTFGKWTDFFRHVYDPIVRESEKNIHLSPRTRKQIARIHEQLDRLIAHGDGPRLVHWDLWSSNLLAREDSGGKWRICAVLDPNCKYAHAEAELAYLDLFHTSTPTFMKAYQRGQRLDDGYHRARKAIYQLYTLIDHVNLFGQEYMKPMLAALDKAADL